MYQNNILLGNSLSDETLRQLVPAAFSTSHSEDRSEKYKHLTTIDVVNALRDKNFVPVFAYQSARGKMVSEDHKKHMIRLRHKDHLDAKLRVVGDVTPELVLVNSHDGTTPYQFYLGLHRLVCSNGLITQTADGLASISVRHSGKLELLDRVGDVSEKIVERVPLVASSVSEWQTINLDKHDLRQFAKRALEIKPNANIDAEQLLEARRPEDASSNDLWTVFNRVQENLIRGGLVGDKNGRQTRTRNITNITENLRINKDLWKLAQDTHAEMA